VREEELADDLEKDTEFDRNVENWAKVTKKSLMQSMVDASVRKYPQLQEPEAQEALAAILQEAEMEQQRDAEARKKERDEFIRSI
jgi:hypothetical protein